jgi:signal transduction histidine kinase
VAHELRTPLSNIRGYLEAIRDGVLPADQATVETLHQQSTHLSQLVDDLALLARAEAGALALDVRTVSLGTIVRQSVEAFQARADAAGVSLELDVADNLPDVLADSRRVSQIISNLMENAMTHTPAGGTVTVSAGVSEGDTAETGAVDISVSDTGGGIAPDDLERVFDRFYRTDPSRARATGGSGLGLTIARQLAAAHGGNLTATSTLGEGSRFICTLPVRHNEPG